MDDAVMGPVEARRGAVTRAGLTLDDLDVIQLHDVFAWGMGTAMVVEVA